MFSYKIKWYCKPFAFNSLYLLGNCGLVLKHTSVDLNVPGSSIARVCSDPYIRKCFTNVDSLPISEIRLPYNKLFLFRRCTAWAFRLRVLPRV